MQAYMHYSDGARWIRIIDENGSEWDEPIQGWSLVLDLIRGGANWRHDDGREYRDGLND
jgi:hypothetical protein